VAPDGEASGGRMANPTEAEQNSTAPNITFLMVFIGIEEYTPGIESVRGGKKIHTARNPLETPRSVEHPAI
jgi:hypothetical protein